MSGKRPNGAGPIFVFTIHRSGSTALSRILNCHPNVTIWGEHGGFINQLAEIDAIMQRAGPLHVPMAERHLEDHIAATDLAITRFDPWCSPVSHQAFDAWARDYIHMMFANMLPAKHRWGFKEVRYHSLRTARFLTKLFPWARFILLTREIGPLCVANIFSPWSLDRLKPIAEDEAEIGEAVTDCVYAIMAMKHNFRVIAEHLGDRVLSLTYADITDDTDVLVNRLFTFLDLDADDELHARIRQALTVRSGATPVDGGVGLLTREYVLSLVPNAMARAARDLEDGLDLGRLKRLKDQGRYSFLLGDHALQDTFMSSMF